MTARTYAEMSREEIIEVLRALTADPRLQTPTSETERLIHDLQVHQLELEMQNRELREAQHQIEESRSRYADLYDFAPVVYFTLDREGRIREANLTAASLFKMDRGALVGSLLVSLVAMESQQACRAHIERCLTERTRVTSELTFSVPGARSVVAQMSSTPVMEIDDTITGCKTTLTDISALKRSEAKLRMVAQVSAVLASSFDYMANLASAVRLMVPMFADICFVDVLDASGKLHRIEVAFADSAKQHLADTVRYLVPPATGRAPQAHVLRTGEPIMIPECRAAGLLGDSAGEIEYETLIRVSRARSLMFVPLVARERTLGVATFVMAESNRRYSATDLQLGQDLASRAAMAIDNAQLYLEAQRAVEVRENILSVVSHDLKNPLAIIMLSTVILLRMSAQPDPAKQQRQLEMIHRSATQMERMIRDLLDMASIELGRLSIEPDEHDLGDLMRDACEALLPLAREKGLELGCHAPDETLRVMCDRERVLQVFSNLVGNAIKFTPAGGSITIRAEVHGRMARVGIRDTGPGIPEALLSNVFKRHWQARETARKGLGLGLHISKGIVEAQGGTIWVESQAGAGTTFYFTMPLAARRRDEQRDDFHASNP